MYTVSHPHLQISNWIKNTVIDPWLVESFDSKAMNTEDQLHIY